MERVALLTGMTGFIGGRLARRLISDGWLVHAIVRPQTNYEVWQDVRQLHLHVAEENTADEMAGFVAASRPHTVFHLASLFLADHRPDQVAPLIESNLSFSTRLVEAMCIHGCRRLVNTGTSWQHYQGADYRPVNLYAATKQAFEDILEYYHEARELSVVTLRLFDTYGLGDKRRKLIRTIIDALDTSETLEMSPGEQVVDMTHVDDVVSAFVIASERLAAMPSPVHEAFLVSGERFSVRELVEAVRATTDKDLSVHFGGRPYRNREVMTPVTDGRIPLLPGWVRQISMREVIPDLIGQ